MGAARTCALLALALLAGCTPAAAPPETAKPTAVPEDPRVAKARELLGRAETAPLPTPEPAPSPVPRGWKPGPAPEFKPDEVEAVRLLEESAAADPGRPEAHEMLARILEPAALRRHARESARPKKGPAPPAPPDQGIDTTPARVVRALRAAVEASPGYATAPLDALVRFGAAVGDLEAADWAHREKIRRAGENAPEKPLVAYADFLLESRRDPLAAAEQYRNALLWKPDDAEIKGKLARIFLGLAQGHLAKDEWAAAEARVGEAEKYAAPDSEAAREAASIRQRLGSIRR